MKYRFKLHYIAFAFSFFTSCLAHTQNEPNAKNKELEEVKAALYQAIDSLNLYIADDAIPPYRLTNSLSDNINRLESFIAVDSVDRNDSLKQTLETLSQKLTVAKNHNQQLHKQISQLREEYSDIFRLSGTHAFQVKTRQSVYDCYKVNLKETKVSLFWQNEKGQPLRSLDSLQNYVKRKGQELIFAMNAGMYLKDNSPQGLYIQEGKKLRPIDRRKEEYGNFYMQPNGVFLIDTANMASIVVTEEFDSTELKKAVYATQSGPMVLINGQINDKFNPNSDSKHFRNGVGIIDEHNLVFIISNRQVNLYDFANVFKEKFNCSNALYLDGAISRMYLPELKRLQKGGRFGPLIGISK